VRNNDSRSRRIALVADAVMNPAPGAADLLSLIATRDWGVIALPPERLGEPAISQWIAGVADQVREFRRHGMVVVAVLDPRDKAVVEGLARSLAETPPLELPIHATSGGNLEELSSFLDRCATALT